MRDCSSCGARLEDEATRCARCGSVQPIAGGAAPASSRSQAGPAPAQPPASEEEPKVQWGVGYLLVIVGFAVSVFPNWAILGCLIIWIGCGLGMNVSAAGRWGGGLVIAITLSIFGAVLGTWATAPAGLEDPEDPPPFLIVSVENIEYDTGELSATGMVGNTGDGAAYDPSIELYAFDEAGDVLLAAETAYPAGKYRAELPPGRKATFALEFFIPDEPECVRWIATNEDYPGAAAHRGMDLGIPEPAAYPLICDSSAQ